jgi:hypothetical protein
VRTGRWVGAIVLLVIGALLAGVSVVAVYARSQVLDTETFVSTMAPLVEDEAVQDAIAQRLANEIVSVTRLDALATATVNALESRGAPAQLSDFVGTVVASLTTFLFDKIKQVLQSPTLQAVWRRVLRFAHTRLVAILTGGQAGALSSGGDTITVDIGSLLSAAKSQLVNQGLTFVSKVPDVSLPFTVIESDKLPTVRKYAKVLDKVAAWLPYVALVVLLAGILVAPRRRRGVVIGAGLTAAISALLLIGVIAGRSYYLDNLPPAVQSPAAAAALIDAVLLYLVHALQTLLVAAGIVFVVAFLAGPARLATGVRRLVNVCLAGVASGLDYLGPWARAVGSWLARARTVIQIVLVLGAVVWFIAAVRPSIASVLWGTLILGVVLAIVEAFIRITRIPSPGPAAAAANE